MFQYFYRCSCTFLWFYELFCTFCYVHVLFPIYTSIKNIAKFIFTTNIADKKKCYEIAIGIKKKTYILLLNCELF